MFEVTEAARRQQLALTERSERRLHQASGKRRIEENQIVGARRLRTQECQRIAAFDACTTQVESFGSGAQVGRRRAVLFHQHCTGRATRQRFEGQRAVAGKQVEHAHAVDVRCQPVEQRFAHAIRRGPQARRIQENPFPAAQGATDDAQFPCSTLHAPSLQCAPLPEERR
jgi:hypothetical protein